MMLWEATDGSEGSPARGGLPAAPAMEEVREHNTRPSKRASRSRAAAAGKVAVPGDEDAGAGDESTYMLGKRLPMPKGPEVITEIENAVGFFLYITLPGNVHNLWPQRLGRGIEDGRPVAGRLPQTWHEATTDNLASMFSYRRFSRCQLYGDTYVTSASWGAQQERDNSWILFQHHAQPCAPPACVDSLFSYRCSCAHTHLR